MAEWSSFNATTTVLWLLFPCHFVFCAFCTRPSIFTCFMNCCPSLPHLWFCFTVFFGIYPLFPLSLPPSSPSCVMHHLSHLCRVGRPIITPACKYWSTAPVSVCYFKMLRPVISVLMIVIAKATSSVRLFQACGYQLETGSAGLTHTTHTRVSRSLLVF